MKNIYILITLLSLANMSTAQPGTACATAISETENTTCVFTPYTTSGPEMWFSFVATTPTISVTVIGDPFGIDIEHIHNLALFAGTCANLQPLADDELVFVNGAKELIIDASGLIVGNTYFLRASRTGEIVCEFGACTLPTNATFVLCIEGIDEFIPPDIQFELASQTHLYYRNKGQVVDNTGQPRFDVRAYTTNTSPSIYFTDQFISFAFTKIDTIQATIDSMHRVDMTLVGEVPTMTRIHRIGQGEGHLNYFVQHVPTGIRKIKGFERIVYPDVYPDIDLQVFSSPNGTKLYFVIRPGGDASLIEIKFSGQDNLSFNAIGGLNIETSLGTVSFEVPHAYKISPANNIGGMPQPDYLNTANGNIKFDNLGNVPPNFTMVIVMDQGHAPATVASPIPEWGTYFGGVAEETTFDAVTDNAGNFFVTGETGSTHTGQDPFPFTAGAFQDQLQGLTDAFIARFGIDYDRKWVTYFGGDDQELGLGITVGSVAGIDRVYVCGKVASGDAASFPLVPLGGNSFFNNFNQFGGGFIARFDIAFGFPEWSTFIGTRITCTDITTDANGNIYLVGYTENDFPGIPTCPGTMITNDFPLCDPGGGTFFQGVHNGGSFALFADGFITKFNQDAEIVWSTWFGGNGSILGQGGDDLIKAVAVDDATNALYVGGFSNSDILFPWLDDGGYFSDQLNGTGVPNTDEDGFVARFTLDGVQQWSTFFGSGFDEGVTSLAVGLGGDIYVAGITQSSLSSTSCNAPIAPFGFPICTTASSYSQPFGGGPLPQDHFIARFSEVVGHQLEWSTFIGGSGDEGSPGGILAEGDPAITVNSDGQLLMSGTTFSTDFPVLFANGFYFQSSHADNGNATDAYVLGFNANDTIIWGTYYGGQGNGPLFLGDASYDVATFQNSRVYITGPTHSTTNFPLNCPIPATSWCVDTCTSCGAPNFEPDVYYAQLSLGSGAPLEIGENSNKREGLTIYPNPTNGQITVHFHLEEPNEVTLRIFNIVGELVYEAKEERPAGIFERQIDLSGLANGVYYLNLQAGQLTDGRKIIKQF